MQYPILRYPDPEKGYVLYTDASSIGWSGSTNTGVHGREEQSKTTPHMFRERTI